MTVLSLILVRRLTFGLKQVELPSGRRVLKVKGYPSNSIIYRVSLLHRVKNYTTFRLASPRGRPSPGISSYRIFSCTCLGPKGRVEIANDRYRYPFYHLEYTLLTCHRWITSTSSSFTTVCWSYYGTSPAGFTDYLLHLYPLGIECSRFPSRPLLPRLHCSLLSPLSVVKDELLSRNQE